MSRPKATLVFAEKLLGIAEDARQQLTNEEIYEAFFNLTRYLHAKHEPKVIAQTLAEVLADMSKNTIVH